MGQPQAGAGRGAGRPAAGVAHDDGQAGAVAVDRDAQLAATGRARNAVLDRVLHQQLQQHGWQAGAVQALAQLPVHAQSGLVVQLFQCDVVAHHGQLVGQRDALLGAVRERVPQILAYMQLSEKADARVNQLSGGMKRRLTIGRALVNDPDLLFLDEPTTGLDPQARVMIWQRILELKKQGKTLLLTTHYMDEAQRLCDHIIMIDHGMVLDEGSPSDLIDRHVKKHVFDVTKPIPLDLPPVDSEDVGDSVLFYVDDGAAFRKQLPENATYLHRPANMEDVFLRLTGRKLRD
ncbi:MAG: nodulation factor ABC transporter ATP-binding protein NodI [Pseudomonas fluorescens]|nr:MAG: nodulation factor ABC transporter ATP-binding protein NodI [Pseudomonas fluorescens]